MYIYYFLLFICIICNIIRTIYEILKYKGKIKGDNHPFYILIIINMIILFGSWIQMSKNDPYKIQICNWIKYTGLFIYIIGLILFFLSIIKLKGFSDKNILKQNGIYLKIRHPMFYGVILWMIGTSIFHGAFLTLIISSVFILNILLWRSLEEKVLETKFEKYKQYKKNTWF